MTSAKAVLGAIAGRFLFTRSTVDRVTALERFRRIELSGAELRDVAWTPGDKVRVFLPGEGMRTYTPLSWDRRGSTTLLAFVHGEGPGSRWASTVKPGDEVSFFGPRRSIDVTRVEAPLALFGDETSVALALSLSFARPLRRVTAVLEVHDAVELRRVLDGMGSLLDVHLLPRGAATTHADAIAFLSRALGDGAFGVFTGRAASVQAVKAGLRGRSFASKTKAYWAEGKRGLD